MHLIEKAHKPAERAQSCQPEFHLAKCSRDQRTNRVTQKTLFRLFSTTYDNSAKYFSAAATLFHPRFTFFFAIKNYQSTGFRQAIQLIPSHVFDQATAFVHQATHFVAPYIVKGGIAPPPTMNRRFLDFQLVDHQDAARPASGTAPSSAVPYFGFLFRPCLCTVNHRHPPSSATFACPALCAGSSSSSPISLS